MSTTEQQTQTSKSTDTAPHDQQDLFWLWLLKKNRENPILEFKRKWNIGKLQICFSWRSKKNTWGRFGGGWNWKCGFSIGSTTIYFHLLVADLSFYYPKNKA